MSRAVACSECRCIYSRILDIADADADVWLAGGLPCLATDRATARICHSLTMRCRFLRPLYRALNNSKSGTAKKAAVETFERNKRSYHPIAGLWSGEACGNPFFI